MGDRDRHSRSTQPLGREVLEALAATSVKTSRIAIGTARPTCKLHKDEIVGLVTHSVRAPTSGFPAVVPQEDRATQQMDPTHFQLLLRTQRENLPISPEDILCMHREEAEAWLQMCAPAVIAAGSENELVVPILAVDDPHEVRHVLPPTAPRLPEHPRRWWHSTGPWIVAVAAVAVVATVALIV